MPNHKAPPEIFDKNLLAVRHQRAAARQNRKGVSFLLLRAAEDLAARMLDVNRRFEKVLIHGQEGLDVLINKFLPQEKRPLKIVHIEDAANMSVGGDFDLIVSLMRLHSENDLTGALISFRKALKPDGLFIGALFGGDTLQSLRHALYATDEIIQGGMTARIFPMITHTQAGQLLSHAGFNQPVIDIDRVTVNYSKLKVLISDLRDLGETNVLTTWDRRPLGQDYWLTLKQQAGILNCSYEILWMTGWVPHESQQKPLKPGSAKMRLADALKRKN